jgi:hypothetical protein
MMETADLESMVTSLPQGLIDVLGDEDGARFTTDSLFIDPQRHLTDPLPPPGGLPMRLIPLLLLSLALTACGPAYEIPGGYPQLEDGNQASLEWTEDGASRAGTNTIGCLAVSVGDTSHFVSSSLGEGDELTIYINGHEEHTNTDGPAITDDDILMIRTLDNDDLRSTNFEGASGSTSVDGFDENGAFWGSFHGRLCGVEGNDFSTVVCIDIDDGRYSATFDDDC